MVANLQKQNRLERWDGREENPQVCLPDWVRRVRGVSGGRGNRTRFLRPPDKRNCFRAPLEKFLIRLTTIQTLLTCIRNAPEESAPRPCPPPPYGGRQAACVKENLISTSLPSERGTSDMSDVPRHVFLRSSFPPPPCHPNPHPLSPPLTAHLSEPTEPHSARNLGASSSSIRHSETASSRRDAA